MKATEFLRAAESWPLEGLEALLPDAGPVLLLSPHPDDESLGCGGLLAQLAARGRGARVVLVSDGAASHASRLYPPRRLAALRREEMVEALAALGLGAERLVTLGLPDGAVPGEGPGFEAAATAIAGLALRDGATTILAPWEEDPHGDHLATWRMARHVARDLGLRLLAYPVWGWRHLYPGMLAPVEPVELATVPRGVRLDISAELPAKRAAVAAHRSQTTGIIEDDPDGFVLSPAALDVLLRPWELYLEVTP